MHNGQRWAVRLGGLLILLFLLREMVGPRRIAITDLIDTASAIAETVPPPQPSAALTTTIDIPSSWPLSQTVTIGSARQGEANTARFLDDDHVAYLQNGVLYRYALSTRQVEQLSHALNVTAFTWSTRHRQFVIAGNGRLLLLDESGLPPVDLSIHMKTLSADEEVEVESCDQHPPPFITPTINLFDVVAWAGWDPDQRLLLFATDIHDGDLFCRSYIWAFDSAANKLQQLAWVGGFLARPLWLDNNTFMIEQYTGGGGRTSYVINVADATKNFYVRTDANIPCVSPNGMWITNIEPWNLSAQFWNVAQGGTLTTRELTRASAVADMSSGCWSATGRYLAIAQTDPGYVKPATNFWEFHRLRILTTDSTEQWLLPKRFGQGRTQWLPSGNALFVFDWQDAITTVYRVDVAKKEIETIGQIKGIRLEPESWSATERYLLLVGYDEAQQVSYWVWDNRTERGPFRIGQPALAGPTDLWTAKWLWSPSDQWLLRVSAKIKPDNSLDQVAFQAIQVGQE